MVQGNHAREEGRRAYTHPRYGHSHYESQTERGPPREVGRPGVTPFTPLEPSPTNAPWTPHISSRDAPSQTFVERERNVRRDQLPSIRDLMHPPPRTSPPTLWTSTPPLYQAPLYGSPRATAPRGLSETLGYLQPLAHSAAHLPDYADRFHDRRAPEPPTGTLVNRPGPSWGPAVPSPGPIADYLPGTSYLQLPATHSHPQVRYRSPRRSTEPPQAFSGPSPRAAVQERSKTSSMQSSRACTGGRHHVDETYAEGEDRVFTYEDATIGEADIEGEKVNTSWGLTKAGKPRKRLAQACLPCREKKVKCEPGVGPDRCMHCEKSKISCTRPPGTQASVASSSNAPSNAPSTSNPESPVSRRSSTAKHRRNSNSTDDKPSKRRTSLASSADFNRQSAPQSTADETRRIVPRTKSHASAPHYEEAGNSGPVGPHRRRLSDIMSTRERLTDPIVQVWETDPYHDDPALTLALIHNYFTHVNAATYCMFPRNTFTNWVKEEAYKSADDRMLLYTMLALGSIFTYDDEKKAAGKEFAEIARFAIEMSHGKFSLQLVQSRLLFGLYCFSLGKFADAWDYCGSTLRALCGLRLNLEKHVVDVPGDAKRPYGLARAALMECRRRTFWSSFLLDRYNGFCSGFLCTIQVQDTFLRLPCPEEAYEESVEVETPYFDNGIINVQKHKPSVPATQGAMAFLVLISAIWGDVLASAYRAVYRPDASYREEHEKAYAHADHRLKAWVHELPSSLHYTQKNTAQSIVRGYVGTFVSLHALYHTTVIQLNRHAKPHLLPASTVQRYIRTAREHARRFLLIIRTLDEADREANSTQDDEDVVFAFSTPFVGFAIVSAVDILSAGGLRSELPHTRELIRVAEGVVEQLSRFWCSAKDQLKAIEERVAELDRVAGSPMVGSAHAAGRRGKEKRASGFWRLEEGMEMEMGFDKEHDCIYGSDAKIFFEAVGRSG